MHKIIRWTIFCIFPSCKQCLLQLIRMFRGDNSAKIKSAPQKVLIGKQILWERKQHDAISYGAAAISDVSLH